MKGHLPVLKTGPSEEALDAAQEAGSIALFAEDCEKAVWAVHDPKLGLKMSVQLEHVVDHLKTMGEPLSALEVERAFTSAEVVKD